MWLVAETMCVLPKLVNWSELSSTLGEQLFGVEKIPTLV